MQLLLIAFLAATSAANAPPRPPSLQAAPPTAPACTKPEFRQFDFWVGDWKVYATGSSYQVGESRVERLYGGCVLRENWQAIKGPAGGSLNTYVPATRSWRQTWADGSGSWTEYSGTFQANQMRYLARGTNRQGAPVLLRMVFTANADGTVRQTIEASTDEAATWTMNTDLTYRRKSGS